MVSSLFFIILLRIRENVIVKPFMEANFLFVVLSPSLGLETGSRSAFAFSLGRRLREIQELLLDQAWKRFITDDEQG